MANEVTLNPDELGTIINSLIHSNMGLHLALERVFVTLFDPQLNNEEMKEEILKNLAISKGSIDDIFEFLVEKGVIEYEE